ncbi:MAG: FlgD immunoglobulin-like domain containing protein [Bacteroidota bacterium]
MRIYSVIFFGLCLLATAQPAKITSLGPDGGIITGLEGSLTDAVVLAVVDERILYRSIDGGESWNAVTLPSSSLQESIAIRDIEIHPLYPDTMFLGTSQGLLRSMNGGLSWSFVPTFPFPRFNIRYAPGNFSVLIGSDEAGVLRSTDGGNSWMPLKDNIFFGDRLVRRVAIHPSDGTPASMRILATTGFEDTTGIFLTTNGGTTWQPLITGLPQGDARRIYAAEFDSTGLGSTHYRIIIGTAAGLYAMQTDQNNGAWQEISRSDIDIKGVVTGGVLVYDKYDTTTSHHQFDFFISLNGSEMDRQPKQHTTGNGVFKISSRFSTILPILSTSLPPVTHVFDRLCNINSIFVPLLSDKKKLYIGTTSGVFISIDGGTTWQRKSAGIRHTEIRNLISFFPNIIINKNLFAASYGGGVFRSTDDGATWSESNAGLLNPFVTTVAVDTERNILYAGTVFTLYRSIDAGKTWSSIFPVDSSAVVNPSRYNSRSNDMTVRISPVNSDIIMFRTPAYGLRISINGGASWSFIDSPAGEDLIDIPENIAFDPANSSTIYFAGSGLYKSTNRGTTWSDISSNLPDSVYSAEAGRYSRITALSPTINPRDANEIFLATVFNENDGAPHRIFKTTDGGGTWTALAESLKAYDIFYDILDVKRIITSGPGGIFLSTDRGMNWTVQSNPPAGRKFYLLDRHATKENIIYVGSDHGAHSLELADYARLAVDTLAYSFGSILVGRESTQTVFLRNTAGTRNVIVTFAGLSDTNTFSYGGAADYDIPAGGQTSFTISFKPSVGGSQFAILRFLTTDDITDTLRFLLKGHAFLRSSIDKFAYDFGSVTAGSDSIIAATVDNQFGLSSIAVTYLGQTDSAHFRYLGEQSLVIDTGMTVPLFFQFRPQSAGAYRSTAYFTTSDPKFPAVKFTMTGTGVVRNTLSRKVLIDSGVGFVAFDGSTLSGHYRALIRMLERAQIGIDLQMKESASHYSAIVYVLPDGAPSRDIIDSLQRYIVSGGTIVIVGDHGDRNDAPFNTVLQDTGWAQYNVHTGLRYNTGLIVDLSVTDPTIEGRVIAYPYRKSFLTNNVDSVILYFPGSISVDSSVSNAAPLLVATSPLLHSVSSLDTHSVPVASAIIAAISLIGKGKLIAVADADLWWNGLEDDSLHRFGIFAGKNMQFALNVFGSADNVSASLPQPTPQEAYKLISIPYSFNDSSVIALFRDLGPPNDLVWRMFGRWDEEKGYAEFPEDFKNIRRGEAYWLITKKPVSVSFGTTSVQGSEEDFEISLSPGYTMIGNPFPYAVSWANSYREDSTVEKILWKYDHGFDTTTQVMEPFEGYFVNNRSDTIKTIRINSSPVSSAGSLLKDDEPLRYATPSQWTIRVSAETPAASDRVNFIGVLDRAHDGFDEDDFSSPPSSPAENISLSFKSDQRNLSADFRSINKNGHVWIGEVTTSTPGTPFSLKLTKFDDIPAHFKIFLLDIEKERAYDISESLEFSGTFEKKQFKRNFKLLVGTNEFIVSRSDGIPIIPFDYALYQNFPNPFNPSTTVLYSLARSGAIRLEVFNLIGQKVKTLVHENLKIGRYSVEWDGTNDKGEPVASGVYYYRLKTSQFNAVKKMVLIK